MGLHLNGCVMQFVSAAFFWAHDCRAGASGHWFRDEAGLLPLLYGDSV